MSGSEDGSAADDPADASAALRTRKLLAQGRRASTRKLLRDRAKQRWPTVALSLVSIIQALALETLWSELTEEGELLAIGVDAVIIWSQASIVFLTVILIWVFFAQLVMRFVWLPGLRDSVTPFALGMMEFVLAEFIGAGFVGLWIALVGAAMLLSHLFVLSTFARAAKEPENGDFFSGREEFSVLRRHGPMLGSVALLLLLAGVVELTGSAVVSAVALVLVLILVFAQLLLQRYYWHRSFRP